MTERAPSPIERRQTRKRGRSWFDRSAPHDARPGTPSRPRPPGLLDRVGSATAPIAVFAFVILLFSVLGLWLWHDRTRTLANGDRVASNLARVLEEQTLRTFQGVDLTLVGIVDALRLSPPPHDHDPEFEETMRQKKAMLPYVRSLFVVGPDGVITQDTDQTTPHASLADRGYFIAHAKDPDLELYIGPPLISRSVGVWFVSMSRRIANPDGSFGGIAVAAIEPRYFETFYDGLRLGRGDVIALFNRDGTLIARNPRDESAIGRASANLELFQRNLEEKPLGTFHTQSAFDNKWRIISYRALDHYPLVVAVGLSEDSMLAEWRQNATAATAGTVLISALAIALAIVMRRQQMQRERARERLAQVQKLEALGHMTGGIVHDFKNLLSAVAAGATAIQGRSPDDEVRKIAEMMTEVVERGNRLTAQLLAFARRQELTVEPEDANAMIRKTERLLRHAAGPKVKLLLTLAPAVWPCLLDRSQFDAAMVNLVVNAKDAMPDGGTVRIATTNWRVGPESVADAPPGDYVRVSVADDGEGMPPEVMQRALDPFFTTKADSGTGLGLSQVYGFVRQIGGDLRIESRVGAGTTVHLYFPRADAARSG